MPILNRLRQSLDSLSGRTVLVLTIGIATASIVSLLITDQYWIRNFQRAQLERVATSVTDFAGRYARDPAATTALFHNHQIFGAHEAPARWHTLTPNPELGRMLAARLGAHAGAQAMLMSRMECFPELNLSIRAAGMNEASMPDCWYVRFYDAHGIERRLAVDNTTIPVPRNSALDPLFLVLIVVASGGLSYLVARVTVVPLRRLTEAARRFSVMLDPEPIPEHGPSEIRAALTTFNIMQARVNEGFRERTQILASIAHDLQTPLTRLKLRVEHLGDPVISQQLAADLAAMQQLVRDGLDLARSSVSEEAWSVVDIDSILSSVAEDAAEFGNPVRFLGGCGAHAHIKPNALIRALNNLVDNAVKYAGDAELSCTRDSGELIIQVRDHGPGIPDDQLDFAQQPFKRLDRAVPGTGIGLAIARAQAETFGASLGLANHPAGGLVATIRLQAVD